MTAINVIKDVSLTLRGILKYFTFFKNSCTWDQNRIKEYQYKKLKKLLISATEVPYYRKLFTEIDFDPAKDFNSLEDLSKVPVLTKDLAKKNKHLLANPKYTKSSIIMRTSGSTGQPFEVNVYHKAWIVEQAVVWRHWIWSGYRFRDKMAIVRSYVPKSEDELIKKDKLRNFIFFSPFHLNDHYMSIYLNRMIEENVKIIRGYPSSVYLLANFVLRTNHAIPKLKFILTASEELTNHDRAVIEEAFKVKVTNHYGLAEVCVMMGDCSAHNGLHNYDDYGYLELMDTSVENEKKIIGTNLHNMAYPLIRYDTGDIAVLRGEYEKECPHTFNTVGNIKGRADQYILTNEGYKIPTVNFYTLFESFQEVIKWQIIQKKVHEIEVRITFESLSEKRKKELVSGFYKRLPKTFEISFIENNGFIQKNEGKINAFISEIKK